MSDEIDVFNFLLSGSREYELIGEFYPFAHWNKSDNRFDKIIILNPDYVVINQAYLSYANELQVELEPDEDLKRIIHSNDYKDLELRQGLDPIILRSVEEGVNIPIDSFAVAQIARKGSPYDPRGKSIILRCMKTLLYDDKLVEAQFSQADNMITPRQIWKMGDPQNGYMPNDDDLDDFRALLKQSAHDPNFAIVTHYGLQLELVGFNGKILPIVPERQYNEERILTALYTNKAVLKGEGPGFSAGPQVAFQYLQGRYLSKRQKLEAYLKNKIFIPFAIANGFWKKSKTGEKELILPQVKWDQKLNLVEDQGKRQFLSQLYPQLGCSWETLMEVFDVDSDEELRRLQIQIGGITDPIQIEKRRTEVRSELMGASGGGGIKGIGDPSKPMKPLVTPSVPTIKSTPDQIKPPNTPGQKMSGLRTSRSSYFTNKSINEKHPGLE